MNNYRYDIKYLFPFFSKEGDCTMKNRVLRFFGLLILTITIIISLFGCVSSTPQATNNPAVNGSPEKVNTTLSLPDGSRAEMLPGTTMSIIINDIGEQVVSLQEGTVMLLSNKGENSWFTLQTGDTFSAKVKGCSMVVSYSAAENSFSVECLVGSCSLVLDSKHSYTLEGGKYLTYKNGTLQPEEIVNMTDVKANYTSDFEKCLVVPITVQEGSTPTVTVSPTVSATVDLAATATAACSVFQSQFPATPCP